jgi:hypothetical protein
MDQLPQFGSQHRIADGDRWEGRRAAQPFSAKAAALTPSPGFAGCRASLARTIELDIIPRLVRAHCPAPAQQALEGADGQAEQAATEYTQWVLDGDSARAMACLSALRSRGASLQWLCREVLGPAARCLGARWQEDLGEFELVSRALWRLQQLGGIGLLYAGRDAASPKALLAPAPGEEPTVGLGILAESLRRAGWAVWGGTPVPIEAVCAEVACGHFDLVALSVSCHSRLDLVAASVRAVRAAAAGRKIGVLIAGPQEVERAPD